MNTQEIQSLKSEIESEILQKRNIFSFLRGFLDFVIGVPSVIFKNAFK